jgi:hypothetical protein
MTELNGRRFTVASATTDTFALAGEDGTAHGAYLGGGVARKAVAAIGGLDHLEGESIDVLADGVVLADRTVASGSVALPVPASRIHAGYRYVTDLETLSLEAGATDGTAQGKTKRIHHVVLRLFRTRGARVGPDAAHLEAIDVDTGAPGQTPPPLFSGDVEIAFGGGYTTDATILIRQDQPLPMSVLAIMPRVDTAAR